MATKKKPTQKKPSSAGGSSDSDLLEKGQLGHYEIKKKLGAGGMGTVYLALDQKLNRLVALKILPQDKAENPILVRRFQAEAQAAAALTHDHIVRIYESGEIDNYKYISLEYVEGTDVHRLIKKRTRLPVRRSTEIIKQVTQALLHASDAGIVHRDIKPANLLITQSGVVKLTDLGLARALDDEETSITRDGTTVGTVDYMSPEQGRSSKAADIRSDLYSLGCTWFHMLTGKPPYPEGNITNKLHAHATAPIPDPRSINDSVPESIVGVISRLMAKKPLDRYQTAQELLDDLDAVKKNSRKEISATDLAALASSETIGEEEEETAESGQKAMPARSKQDSSSDTKAAKGSFKKPSGSDSIPPREKKKLSDVEGKSGGKFNWLPFAYVGGAICLVVLIGLLGSIFSGVGDSIDSGNIKGSELVSLSEERQKERAEELEKAKQELENKNSRTSPGHNGLGKNPDANKNGKPETKQNPVGNGKIPKVDTIQKIEIIDSNKKTGDNSAHSLHGALKKITAEEAIIELKTKSLSIWEQPVEIKGLKLTIRAAKQSSGQILVRSTGALFDGFLSVQSGSLKLEDLHFGLLGYDLPGNKELTFLRASNANLEVRNCSFTMEESRSAPVVLCNASWSSNRVGNSTWTNCLIRGAAWKPFSFSAGKIRSTLKGSLLAIGKQPIYTITHLPRDGSQADASTNKSEKMDRDFSISDSLIVCQQTAFILDNTSDEINVPSTVVRLDRSSFISSNPAGSEPFLAVRRWPENILKTEGDGKLSRLNWVSENTIFSGWNQRLQASTRKTQSTFDANDDGQWRDFWGTTGLEGHWDFKGIAPQAVSGLAYLNPANLKRHALTSQARVEQSMVDKIIKLKTPSLLQKTWRADYTFRVPVISPFKEDSFAKQATKLEVDLSKTDLGEFLATQKLGEKTIIEAKGFGLRTCSPISIKSKQVKIVFISEAGKSPLTLRPVAGKNNPKQGATSWFTVENGTLALENGTFRMQPAGKNPMPNYWIKADQSAIRLKKCYVTAPQVKHADLISLIQISQTKKPEAKQNNGLSIEHCYLQYGGNLIDIDLQANSMFASKSLFISQNHIFNIRYVPKANSLASRFGVSYCTLASRNSHFHFELPAAPGNKKPVVEGFINDTIFVAPIAASTSPVTAIVSSNVKPAELPNRLWWWGARNGYAPEVSGKLLGKPLSQIWTSFWGTGHVESPLFGLDGVMLVKAKAVAKDVKPNDYGLFSKSKAANWSKQKGAIGAPVTEFELSVAGEETKPGKKPINSVAPIF